MGMAGWALLQARFCISAQPVIAVLLLITPANLRMILRSLIPVSLAWLPPRLPLQHLPSPHLPHHAAAARYCAFLPHLPRRVRAYTLPVIQHTCLQHYLHTAPHATPPVLYTPACRTAPRLRAPHLTCTTLHLTRLPTAHFALTCLPRRATHALLTPACTPFWFLFLVHCWIVDTIPTHRAITRRESSEAVGRREEGRADGMINLYMDGKQVW